MFSVTAPFTVAPAALQAPYPSGNPDATPPPASENGKIFGKALACVAECHESGPIFIEINDITRYCALLWGQYVDKVGQPFPPVPQFLALDKGIPLVLDGRLPVVRCVLLASLYIAVCQERAFLPDQSLDVAGLFSFINVCTGDTNEHIVQLLGEPDRPHHCFSEIVLTLWGNQFELRPAAGVPLRLGMAKLVATHLSNETINAPWLKNATLQDCHLANLSFGAVDLTGLRLQRCSLENISMTGTQLRKTHWQHVTLVACRFEACSLELAYFADGTFQNVGFAGCNLGLSYFRSATMDTVGFVDCSLEGITLSGLERQQYSPLSTLWSKIVFQECLWRNTTIKCVRFEASSFGRMINPSSIGKNHLKDCTLTDCTIDVSCRFMDQIVDTRFQKCTLLHTNFTAVRFRNVHFHESTFVRVKFDLSEWRRGTINACQGLANACFARAMLWDVVMTGGKASNGGTLGDMDGADFSYASIHGGGFHALLLNKVSFKAVHGTNVQWDDCALEASDFSQTRFDNAVFSACQLHNANFTGSTGADWVSLKPNHYGTWRGFTHGLIGEPVSCALSLDSAAKLSDPTQRIRLLAQNAMTDAISTVTSTVTLASQLGMANEEGYATTLVGNILALPSVNLRRLAMMSLIQALTARISDGDRMDDVDGLLPLLCHTEYVGISAIEAFVESRIARLLRSNVSGATVPDLEPV